MKRFFSLLLLASALLAAGPARAEEVPIDQDPMFAEMMGETKPAASEASGDEPSFSDFSEAAPAADGPAYFEGSLEASADHFQAQCFEKLGPYSECFEDYEAESCVSQRLSCRQAGEYSH